MSSEKEVCLVNARSNSTTKNRKLNKKQKFPSKFHFLYDKANILICEKMASFAK